MKEDILYIAIALLVIAAAFLSGRYVGRKQAIEVEVVRTDTLVVRDTVRIDRPVYVTRRIVDTMLVAVCDTVRTSDTLYVQLPREQKEYADSTYHAWVSGYRPQLDSIHVVQRTEYVTNTVREKTRHWHIGVQGGYGYGINGFTPYVGIGLTYSLISF